MVASDKTLHDMCVKIPLTKEEMLTANGMGARKLEQYGEAFLYCIRDITNGDKAAYGAEETNYGASEIPLTERAKKRKKRGISSDRGNGTADRFCHGDDNQRIRGIYQCTAG